jgi:DNA-binding Lrp family transcriptional regulator
VHDRHVLDDIDRGLVHALHVDGRAPFARIAAVLGVSTQTVVRRYRRLRDEAGLRVVGLPAPDRPGATRWLVRVAAVPRSAQGIAQALARRPDTSWVRLASGGTEIVAVVDAREGSDESLLLRDVPRTAAITAVSAHLLLHTYRGGPTAWPGRTDVLTDDQQRALTPSWPDTVGDPEPDPELTDLLAADGRITLADLATRTGRSAATVARRLDALRASGALFFDVDLDDARAGVGTTVLLWASVAPSDLDGVATAMASHREPAFVAATTGPTNLAANLVCPDPASLHRYLTGPLAALPGVRDLETAPVLRTVKAAGAAYSS